MYVSDKHVEHAFDILKSKDHAAARAAYEFAEKHLKVILARLEIASNGKTVSDRQNTALASDDYERALEDFKLVSRAYHEAKDRREAANAIIAAWRTQRSDERAALQAVA